MSYRIFPFAADQAPGKLRPDPPVRVLVGVGRGGPPNLLEEGDGQLKLCACIDRRSSIAELGERKHLSVGTF